ncbi:MAG TPA: hypothetical protein VNB22_22960 [Pyrinomonadaceae bacterium]|jgi:hypothetical protein|nr:hypothetical protein [Pyrinomonadaceae bacterium]
MDLRFMLRIAILTILLAFGLTASAQNTERVTYQGKLIVGARESIIMYLGSESGDLAGFCFPNKSSVGRTILSKCKNGQQCKFTGKVNWSKSCTYKENYSAQAGIISVTSVRKISNRK